MPYIGTLLAESLKKDTILEEVSLQVRRIWRVDAGDPSAGQPVTWTFIEFEVSDEDVGTFSDALQAVLAPGPWYCDFRSEAETIVVFSGRVFRYPRGDERAREEAEQHARSVGVPEAQIDWRE